MREVARRVERGLDDRVDQELMRDRRPAAVARFDELVSAEASPLKRDSLFGEQVVRHYHEATRAHYALTYDGATAVGRWERAYVPAGRQLPPPQPLFKKLEPEQIEQERARLGPRPSVQ